MKLFYSIIYFKDLLILSSKLGYFNVIYIIWYRLSIVTGFRKLFFSTKESIITDKKIFNESSSNECYKNEWIDFHKKKADEILDGKLIYFFSTPLEIGKPPNWFKNPFNEKIIDNDFHWIKTNEFGLKTGDIKILWETSRLYWLCDLAIAYKLTGNNQYLNYMNYCLNDWLKKNPYNLGVNWRCGQEVSVRVINILLCLTILKQEFEYNSSIENILIKHLKRIEANILYSIVQDNNHGVSEAAGLFLGGLWLENNSKKYYKIGKKFRNKGVKWLENRLDKLIEKDGSFSQHSTNYHRVLVDLISLVELWNKKFNINVFSQNFYKKADLSISWIESFIDINSGKVPNLGANDGSRILNLHTCAYSDYRPTIQTARKIFSNYKRFESGPWDEPSILLGLEKKFKIKSIDKKTRIIDDSYGIIYGDSNTWAMLRLPKFKFRPKHNDVLHLDIWYKGKNILCDSGSYSYYSNYGEKFKSINFHNTLSFDKKDQMPRFSKFLLKNWINSDDIELLNSKSIRSSYVDYRKNFHNRSVKYIKKLWSIKDTFTSNVGAVEIIWNLNEEIKNYSLTKKFIETDLMIMKFKHIETFSIENSNISEYYNSLTPNIKVRLNPGKYNKVITNIKLKK